MRTVHHLLEVDGLLGCRPNLLVDPQVVFGVDHHAVKPMNGAEFSNAAKDANIWAVYFCENFGDFVFDQAIKVGRIGRLFEEIHSQSLPRKSTSTGTIGNSFFESHKTPIRHNQKYFAAVKTRSVHLRSGFETLCTGAGK